MDNTYVEPVSDDTVIENLLDYISDLQDEIDIQDEIIEKMSKTIDEYEEFSNYVI